MTDEKRQPLFLRSGGESEVRGGRRAFRHRRRCEACGEEGLISRPPLICERCRLLLVEAWRTRQAAGVKAYRVWPNISVKDYNTPHGRTISAVSEAFRYLARHVTSYDLQKLDLEDGGEIAKRRGEPDSWRWVLTPTQAEVLDTAICGLRKLVKQAYTDGFERGRSLLAGIADGSLSVNDVNEWCRRYGATEVDE